MQQYHSLDAGPVENEKLLQQRCSSITLLMLDLPTLALLVVTLWWWPQTSRADGPVKMLHGRQHSILFVAGLEEEDGKNVPHIWWQVTFGRMANTTILGPTPDKECNLQRSDVQCSSCSHKPSVAQCYGVVH